MYLGCWPIYSRQAPSSCTRSHGHGRQLGVYHNDARLSCRDGQRRGRQGVLGVGGLRATEKTPLEKPTQGQQGSLRRPALGTGFVSPASAAGVRPTRPSRSGYIRGNRWPCGSRPWLRGETVTRVREGRDGRMDLGVDWQAGCPTGSRRVLPLHCRCVSAEEEDQFCSAAGMSSCWLVGSGLGATSFASFFAHPLIHS